jgi:hypothetical protein
MRHSDWEQRKMDEAYGRRLDNLASKAPCKNKSPECGPRGECLRCGADQGEVCRIFPPHADTDMGGTK